MKVAIFQFNFFGINTYIVYDPESKECAVIDPGMSSPHEEDVLVNFIESNNLKVKYIVNTHLHIDHVIGNKFLEKKYNVPVYASPQEAPLGTQVKQQAKLFGLIGEFENVDNFSPLVPGEKLNLGKESLEVIDVSGHSPGGLALYDKKDKFVIVGDALFKGSIGRTDLPGGHHSTLIKKINDNLLTLPEDTTVFAGHGEPTTIGSEKSMNPFL